MHLDGKTKSIIEDILNRKAKIALQGEDIREDIKVVAERMGVRPAAANRIMTLVDKERSKGDTLHIEREVIDAVEILTGVNDHDEDASHA
ncbi:hypothetical protein HF289_15495 [Acidithiobacillus ferrooxidans]|uniref:hypothetical protein n=1 Tax=Acidithiobacillus ferrooxidans TaxID=920 RepID=UPI001C064E3E|nr:hypothetical protein [Acidithiobacillus ferrooxidans]MBU2858195.1 hypothetical protein [Acidithiobacillus ferrooxidans]